MSNTYSNNLNELIRWLENVEQSFRTGGDTVHSSQYAESIINLIYTIANNISSEYPYYSRQLPQISRFLFVQSSYGVISVNPIAFGSLKAVALHISAEPACTNWWSNVHPKISAIVKGLFTDGYYSSAAEKAIKELETELRRKFSILNPGSIVPPKVGEIIGALFADNSDFSFCDTSTQSGKDYRRGIKGLLEGAMAAYRNPSAHENLQITKREAMEQILLASQLMYARDNGFHAQ